MPQETVNTMLKVIGLLLMLHACYATYLHRTDRITIYSNYTDAALTGTSPLAALAGYLALKFIDVPQPICAVFGAGVLALSAGIVIRHTWQTNPTFLSFLSALWPSTRYSSPITSSCSSCCSAVGVAGSTRGRRPPAGDRQPHSQPLLPVTWLGPCG